MASRVAYLSLSIIYIVSIAILLLFNSVDKEFNITKESLINIIIFLTLLYISLLLVNVYVGHKIKTQREKQINALENGDYIIDEFLNDKLVLKLYENIIFAKQIAIRQNEEQEKWVHDIKLPLATLKLFIDNNKNRLDSQDIRVLELVALELESDINKKIMFDKIELEIDDFKIERFNFNEVLNEVIRKFRPSFMMKKISLDIFLEEIDILSDKRSVRYILEQIISNAIKYSYDKSIIRIYELEGAIVIENTGEPISDQDINRVFDKGYTGINSSSKGMASTGLGLYMVKKAMTHLNHEIMIKNIDDVTKVFLKFD